MSKCSTPQNCSDECPHFQSYCGLNSTKSIVIPKNATNGDVIKAVFDVTEVRQLDCCAFIDTSDDANMRTYKDWWNAPYKAESEE